MGVSTQIEMGVLICGLLLELLSSLNETRVNEHVHGKKKLTDSLDTRKKTL